MRVIYLDVLLVSNLYVNFLLLRLTARMTHSPARFRRTLLGAALGALSALLILVPQMPFVLSLLCKTGAAGVMCLAAFGGRDRRRLGWQMLCFLGMSCILAGILLALTLSGSTRFYHAGGFWYPDISLRSLVLCTAFAWLVLTLVQYIQSRTHADAERYTVCIRHGAHIVSLPGLADTGNTLTDFYTGKPVIICGRKALGALVPEKLRPLPCLTVSGESLLMVFRPEEAVIRIERTGRTRSVDVLVGLSAQEPDKAIFHPKLLRY